MRPRRDRPYVDHCHCAPRDDFLLGHAVETAAVLSRCTRPCVQLHRCLGCIRYGLHNTR
jgi:hypothetical protein